MPARERERCRCVGIVLLLLSGRAAAQQPLEHEQGIELEDLLVITATLQEQSVLDAPASITVITAADIAARGYRGLPEVLADVVGFTEVSDINEEIVATRGVFASTTNKMLILVNGHRMNDVLLGRYNIDQYLGLEAVERIELSRGPAAPLYGTGALVGVINIITKKGRQVGGTALKYQGGPDGHEASLTWGKLIAGHDVLFNVTFRDQRGEQIPQSAELDVVPRTTGQPPPPKLPGHVYWRRYPQNFSGLLDVRTDDARFTVRGAHFRRITPRGSGGSLFDYDLETVPPAYTVDDLYLDYRKSFRFGRAGGSKLTVNPSVHRFSYTELSFITFGANRMPPLGTRSGTLSEMNNYQLKLTYDVTLLPSLTATAGFDGLLSSMYRNDWMGIDGDGVQLIPDGYTQPGRWLLAGLFLQLVYQATAELKLTVGGRYDTFQSAAAPRFTPRLGLVWRPGEDVAVKLLYGESYLAPQWAHRHSKEASFQGNPGLLPETFRGGDVIVMYQGARAGFTGDVYVNQVASLINRRQLTAPNTGGQYANTGEIVYLGADASADAELLSGLRVNAGYSYIRSARNDVAGPRAGDAQAAYDPLVVDGVILDIPRHTLRYGLRWQPRESLTVSLWGRLTGATTGTDEVMHPPPDPGQPIPPLELERQPWVFLLDASVSYQRGPLTLQLVANNLTDQYYERGGTVPRPLARNGRMLELAAGYRF